jgi:type II secretory pathway pseudopilin PulG
LIELLVVMGILAVLLAITIIAINPARQFAQANDTKRVNDVGEILNAIGQYAADHQGQLPAGITTTATDIKTGGADICSNIMPTYIASLPGDPTTGSAGSITDCSNYDTGYTVIKDANGRVTVSATGQITNPITATR